MNKDIQHDNKQMEMVKLLNSYKEIIKEILEKTDVVKQPTELAIYSMNLTINFIDLLNKLIQEMESVVQKSQIISNEIQELIQNAKNNEELMQCYLPTVTNQAEIIRNAQIKLKNDLLSIRSIIVAMVKVNQQLENSTRLYLLKTEKLQNIVTPLKKIQQCDMDRKRYSEELYHIVGQSLFSLLISLKMIKKLNLNTELDQHLSEITIVTDEALNKVRTMSMEMYPLMLDDLGFIPAIRSYIRNLAEEKNITIQNDFKIREEQIPSHKRFCLYRICQITSEALLNNTLITELNFTLSFEGNEMLIGFNAIGDGSSIELNLDEINERIKKLNGNILIKETPSKDNILIKYFIPQDK